MPTAELDADESMTAMPKAALVHDWLTGMRGGEKVLEACARILPQAPIYTLFHFAGSVEPLESKSIRTSYLQRPARVVANYRYLLPLFPRAIESLDLSAYDVVLSSSHCVAKGAIRAKNAVHVCYCHTPMRYVWDQQKAYFPDDSGVLGWVRQRLLDRLRKWDIDTESRVDQYVANSTFVAQRIKNYYGREAKIIHPPVDVDFYCQSDGNASGGSSELDGSYALAVSALAPYKRLEVAIEGCARAGLRLKIVGTGPERSRLEALSGGQVEFLDFQDEANLRELYRHAVCLLQPGIEDFGITPVEALACGCPVVALGRGGVLDIVEDGVHGVLYRDESAEALAAAIDKCRELRFNFLILRERATAFSAPRFHREMSALLEDLKIDSSRSRGD